MKKVFVVGNKTSKSLSPLIFNYWFKKYKVDAHYSYIEIEKNQFNKTIKKTLLDKEVVGLNITIPYKNKVIKLIKNVN